MRWMIKRDMEEVEQIEQLSFAVPWTSDDFISAMRRRNVVGQVMEVDQEIVIGFVIYEIHKYTFRIVNIAVHPDDRRVGAGRRMVKKLIEKLDYSHRNLISAEVMETNLSAQLFFKSMGFWCEAITTEHYENSSDDCYHFIYRKKIQECEGEA